MSDSDYGKLNVDPARPTDGTIEITHERESGYSFHVGGKEVLRVEFKNNTWQISNSFLLTALEKIADLDPEKDSLDGWNEWGEADCFGKAQNIARIALEQLKENVRLKLGLDKEKSK